jgi:hypothetical protein
MADIVKVRNNSFSGIFHNNIIESTMHFSESWSAEGVDFIIHSDGKEQRVYLTGYEMLNIAAVGLATDFFDVDLLMDVAKRLEDQLDKNKEVVA